MKLFNASQLRSWDQFTIERHYNDSSELMDIAAQSCVDYLEESEFSMSFTFFCGTGNNGGDGLCMARLLHEQENSVVVFIVGDAEKGSDDFRKNLQMILNTDIELKFLSEENHTFEVSLSSIIIDCIFGTGINRKVEGWHADVITALNQLPNRKISIDIPSGLQPDLMEPQSGAIIQADLTLTFQSPKRAMLFPENFEYVGEFEVLNIGLDLEFEILTESDMQYYDEIDAAEELQFRKKFVHKNVCGHVNIMAGSKGKMGAAILSSYAALRAGGGLVTASVPSCGLDILQVAVPEVMCIADEGEEVLKTASLRDEFDATAIGPGIGQAPETALMMRRILKQAERPLVLDADALNIIAHKKLHAEIPANSILTPHVGEFDRLFGKHENSFERLQTQLTKSQEMNVIIVMKGAHSKTTLPGGKIIINSTGNPGMATAGSGDVLTGILASLLGQGYSPEVCARLGVFIHGLAGDIASESAGTQGMVARDIVECIPEAIEEIESTKRVLR